MGMAAGTRRRERPKTEWLEDMTRWSGLSLPYVRSQFYPWHVISQRFICC